MENRQPYFLVITDVRDQGRDTRSFDLMPEDENSERGVDFIPGQVRILRVDDQEPAYFAFATAPEDREVEILVKRSIGASVALFDMTPGGRADLLGAAVYGFDWAAQDGRELVLV